MTDNDIEKYFLRLYEKLLNVKYTLKITRNEFLALNRAYNLINNQNAKIKALQMDNAQLQSDIINATQNSDHIKALYEEEKQKVEKAKQKVIDYCKMLKTAKSEARKELAEKFKSKKFETSVDAYTVGYLLSADDIDELLEELEGKT